MYSIEALRTPCTFVYSPFILKHRLAPSVHVHNPARLAPAKGGKNTPLFLPFPVRVPAASSLTPVTNPQLCRWSCEASSLSASSRPHLSILRAREPSRITHKHTHILSLPPAVARLTIANPLPVFTSSSIPSLSNSRADYPPAI